PRRAALPRAGAPRRGDASAGAARAGARGRRVQARAARDAAHAADDRRVSGSMTSLNGQAYDYDLLVIGSGPAGHRAAIQAAKLDKRVAIVEKKSVVGGVCINTGTIPSKTLREAALRLSGYRDRGIYGSAHTAKQRITMRDLL